MEGKLIHRHPYLVPGPNSPWYIGELKEMHNQSSYSFFSWAIPCSFLEFVTDQYEAV